MTLNANKVKYAASGTKQEPIEPNAYPARVVRVYDLGEQKQRAYQGKAKPNAQELLVVYELGTEFIKDEEGNDVPDKPRWINERFPLFSLQSERARSTQRYLAIDPTVAKGGDWSKLVGEPCIVAVVNNEKNGNIYNNVGTISMPIKGMDVPALQNDPMFFDLDSPDKEVWDATPEWIQKLIIGNENFQGSALDQMLNGPSAYVPDSEGEDDEDVPF